MSEDKIPSLICSEQRHRFVTVYIISVHRRISIIFPVSIKFEGNHVVAPFPLNFVHTRLPFRIKKLEHINYASSVSPVSHIPSLHSIIHPQGLILNHLYIYNKHSSFSIKFIRTIHFNLSTEPLSLLSLEHHSTIEQYKIPRNNISERYNVKQQTEQQC